MILWRRLIQELNIATLGAAILITTRRRELPPNMTALELRRLCDDTVCQLYDLYRDVYTRTLLPVLREQWKRLCQQEKRENAQLRTAETD